MLFLIFGYEALYLLVVGVGYEGRHVHQALCQRCVEVLYGQDSVHSVYTEEYRLVALLFALCQYQGCLRIVEGHVQKLCSCALCSGYCGGKVGLVVSGECCVKDDLDILVGCFRTECIVDTYGVGIGAVVDYGYLACKAVLTDVFCGLKSLVGV